MKKLDKFLLALGFFSILSSIYVFYANHFVSDSAAGGVAKLVQFKNSVRIKSGGSTKWLQGRKSDEISAHGLAYTGNNSSATYLYLGKHKILVMADSLVEFLPDHTVDVKKGGIVILNHGKKFKIKFQGKVVTNTKDNMAYVAQNGVVVEQPLKIVESFGPAESTDVDDLTIHKVKAIPEIIYKVLVSQGSCLLKVSPSFEADQLNIELKTQQGLKIFPGLKLNWAIPDEIRELSVRFISGVFSSAWKQVFMPNECPQIKSESLPPLQIPEDEDDSINLQDTIYLER
jgi:hypothetical protein